MTYYTSGQAKSQVPIQIVVSLGEVPWHSEDRMEPESKLDAYIKRENMMKTGVEPLWRELIKQVGVAVDKCNTQWSVAELSMIVNPEDDLISVKGSPRVDQIRGRIMPHVEIWFNRREAKLHVRRVYLNEGPGAPMDIKPDKDNEQLTFGGKTPLQIAENVVAEEVLGTKL